MCRRVGRSLWDFDDPATRGEELDRLRERLLDMNEANLASLSINQRKRMRSTFLQQEKPLPEGRKVPQLETVENKPIISPYNSQLSSHARPSTNKQDLEIQKFRQQEADWQEKKLIQLQLGEDVEGICSNKGKSNCKSKAKGGTSKNETANGSQVKRVAPKKRDRVAAAADKRKWAAVQPEDYFVVVPPRKAPRKRR